jgi:hypothetical protein
VSVTVEPLARQLSRRASGRSRCPRLVGLGVLPRDGEAGAWSCDAAVS